MKTRVSRFALDRRGNFSIIAAVAAVPLVMAAGMALDLASITRKKSDLQQATDAAALAIVREGKKYQIELRAVALPAWLGSQP